MFFISVIALCAVIIVLVLTRPKNNAEHIVKHEELITQLARQEYINKTYIEEISKLQAQLFEIDTKYNTQLDNNRELLRQKSSQASRSGAYVETLSPFLSQFPVDIFSKEVSVKFLGDPIDFICYDFEKPELVFVEVKSGNSVLSKRQKLVKKIISEGLIRFVEYHMNSDGSIEVKE